MEQERQKLKRLEAEHYQVEQMLDSPSLSREEEEELTQRFQRLQEHIEHQRKIFDDLEFQQFEVNLTWAFFYLRIYMLKF